MSKLIRKAPRFVPPLDPGFRPAYLGHKAFEEAVRKSKRGVPLVFALESSGGAVSRFETLAFPEGHPLAPENLDYAERILKFLLWSRGGWRLNLAGPASVARHLARCYAKGGARAFDAAFMAQVYGRKAFAVRLLPLESLPKQRQLGKSVGRHLEGCRIGFDAGGSDRKVAAVIDGRQVFATETVWHPKTQSDPGYHIAGVEDSLRQAAAHLPRVDAIGVSSAGIFVDNRCRVASLFRKVPPKAFEKKIKNLFPDIAKRWGGVPIEVANDGDVTALAGSMSLRSGSVLGIAMGTSQAVGYVDPRGGITGWLNELAFAPVDYQAAAPVDTEWSGDRGTGVLYFSQEAVIRLAPQLGFKFRKDATPGEKLKAVQKAFAGGQRRLAAVFESIGVYLGYALLQYDRFYKVKHVLLLGRVTSGRGGDIVLRTARKVIAAESPAAAKRLRLHVPDEATRRVGQAVAAASLPALARKARP